MVCAIVLLFCRCVEGALQSPCSHVYSHVTVTVTHKSPAGSALQSDSPLGVFTDVLLSNDLQQIRSCWHRFTGIDQNGRWIWLTVLPFRIRLGQNIAHRRHRALILSSSSSNIPLEVMAKGVILAISAIFLVQDSCSSSGGILATKLCRDFCQKECQWYVTPVEKCYNPQRLFRNDPSWGDSDVLDILLDEQTLYRRFFSTNNVSCDNTTDGFQIPLNECVGPFGKPRPWGNITFYKKASSQI